MTNLPLWQDANGNTITIGDWVRIKTTGEIGQISSDWGLITTEVITSSGPVWVEWENLCQILEY